MAERFINVGDLELWTESFGDPSDETILLISGPGPGLFWTDEFVGELSEARRHVIRYDHRCTGRSTIVDFKERPFTISDIASDAVGVLDAYSVDKAHLVGISGGGAIAQTVALEHRERVATLTSWGSTPAGLGPNGSREAGLPEMEPRAMRALMMALRPILDDEERIERFVDVGRAFSGDLEPFDEERARGLAKRAIVHSVDVGAATNMIAATMSAPDRSERLSKLDVPTLVIHGTVDPAFPLPHGEATAKTIPGARLLAIEGMGHDLPNAVRPQIVAAIVEHTRTVQRSERIRLGVVLPSAEDPKAWVEIARYAEEIGFDSVWVPDGFAEEHPAAFTMMSAIAVSTERIEVGAYMLNAAVYDPALLARAASTLERLAPGRIRAILGTGWDRKDYEALGQEFPSPKVRRERTRAALEMLKGRTGISVEVAGVLDDVLELVALEADGWAVSPDALDAYFERAAFLRSACEQNGRRFDDLLLSCTLPSADGSPERIADLAAHDMGEFRIMLNGEADRDLLAEFVREGAVYAGRSR